MRPDRGAGMAARRMPRDTVLVAYWPLRTSHARAFPSQKSSPVGWCPVGNGVTVEPNVHRIQLVSRARSTILPDRRFQNVKCATVDRRDMVRPATFRGRSGRRVFRSIPHLVLPPPPRCQWAVRPDTGTAVVTRIVTPRANGLVSVGSGQTAFRHRAANADVGGTLGFRWTPPAN